MLDKLCDMYAVRIHQGPRSRRLPGSVWCPHSRAVGTVLLSAACQRNASHALPRLLPQGSEARECHDRSDAAVPEGMTPIYKGAACIDGHGLTQAKSSTLSPGSRCAKLNGQGAIWHAALMIICMQVIDLGLASPVELAVTLGIGTPGA